MPLRRVQTGMVNRFANLTLNSATLFGNLSVAGSLSASNYFGISATGGGGGGNIIVADYPRQVFNTTGNVGPNGTIFTLLSAAASPNDILVFVSGVFQNKSQYFLSDNYTLNLYNAPPAGTEMVEVAYVKGALYAYSTFIPADNTVIESKLADDSVSTAKIQDGAVTFEKLSAIYSHIPVQTLTGDGTTTEFLLVSAVANVNEVIIFISGVYQNKSAYYIGPTPYHVTFSEPPPSGVEVEVSYLRSVPYTGFIPLEFSVNTSQVTDNAITTVKIQDGAVTSAKVNLTDLVLQGNLTVHGNLTAFGEITYLDTGITVTSALSVINLGTSPALVVEQRNPGLDIPAIRTVGDVLIRGSLSALEGIQFNQLDTFKGQTLRADGSIGILPAPSAGEMNFILASDGRWMNPEYFMSNRVRTVGQVLGVALLSGGRGYTSVPRVEIDAPTDFAMVPGPGGSIRNTYQITASAEAIINNLGAVVGFNLIHPGAGYTHYSNTSGCFGSTHPMGKAPPCRMRIIGGGGTGCIAYPIISNNGLPHNDFGNGGPQGKNQQYHMYITNDNNIVSMGYGENYGGTGFNTGANIEYTTIPVRWTDASSGGINNGSYFPVIPVRLYTSYDSAWFIDQYGWVWGQGSGGVGQLGNNDTTNTSFFRRIPPSFFENSPVMKFKASGNDDNNQTCGAINGRGKFWLWGYNNRGQLGRGGSTNSNVPVFVNTFPELPLATWLANPETRGLNNVTDFTFNGANDGITTCVLLGNGTSFSAGDNNQGQFSNNTGTGSSTFQQALLNPSTPLNNITWICGADTPGRHNQMFWLSGNGRIMGAGLNTNNQLVNGNATSVSVAINGVSSGQPNVTQIQNYPNRIWIRGGGSTCSPMFETNSGDLYVGGYNGQGQLGVGDTANKSSYVFSAINTLRAGVRIKRLVQAKGNDNLTTWVLLENGRMFSTGYNGQGQLGAGYLGTSNTNSWAEVSFQRRDIVDITANGYGTHYNVIVLCADGSVYACGANNQAQLGCNSGANVIILGKVRFP